MADGYPAWVTPLPTQATCPYCGSRNPHVGRPGGGAPADGDISICAECRELSVFTAGPMGVALRQPTAGELIAAERDPTVRRMRAALRESYTVADAVALLDAGAVTDPPADR